MRTKKIIALLVALQCALVNASGSNRCTFEPEVSPDEKALLDNVKQALTPMKNNPACQGQSGQIQTFEQAMNAYTAQSVVASGGLTCMNFESEWDSRFQRFTNNWNSPGGSSDPYSSCRGKTSQDEAVKCAAQVTAQGKSDKRTSCQDQRDALSATATLELRKQTLQTGMAALNDVIASPECLDSAGDRRLGVVQSAVGLASQAATIAMLGTGVGILVGAAAQLVNSAIGNIFRNRSKQSLAILENRENFTRFACLYEQIESKALRCDRMAAGSQLSLLGNVFDQANQFCEANKDLLDQNELVTSVDQLIQNLRKQPPEGKPAPVLSMDTFDHLVSQLNERFPGSEESKLDVAERSSKEVVDKLTAALENQDTLTAFLNEREPSTITAERSVLRQKQRELTDLRDRANAINSILVAVREADQKGISMSDEDRQGIEKRLREFNAGPKSFTGAFNEIMIERASYGDDLGQNLTTYNTRLKQARLSDETRRQQDELKQKANSSFEDGGRFLEARNAITPALNRLAKQELETLLTRARTLQSVQPGVPAAPLQDLLRTQEESVLYPMFRICNQLTTTMIDRDRNGNFDASADAFPSICKAFQCQGMSSFERYLSYRNINGIDPKKCDVNCQSHFDRYVCNRSQSLDTYRNYLKNELLTRGTICGKSIKDAFKDAGVD